MECTREPSPQPSTSKSAAAAMLEDADDINTVLPLTVKDEEAEISRLETSKTNDAEAENDERVAKIKFHCASCDMREMVHYFGESPPFAYGIKFMEDTYVMRDPFQPPPPRWKPKAEYYIALGSHCSHCQKCVCKECSFFYTRTFCLSCAEKQIKSFPVEVQTKIRKQIANQKDS